MPIYAYRCAACGHAKDVLQRMSDPPLADCPACGQPRFEKQVTAAGFQLKGSGWYATDFRNPPSATKADAEKLVAGQGEKAAVAGTDGGSATAPPAPAPTVPAAPAAQPAASSAPAAGGNAG